MMCVCAYMVHWSVCMHALVELAMGTRCSKVHGDCGDVKEV